MNDEMIRRLARVVADIDGAEGADEGYVELVQELLSALTPADIATLGAEKLPGWKWVPERPSREMEFVFVEDKHMHVTPFWRDMLAAAPTPGGE